MLPFFAGGISYSRKSGVSIVAVQRLRENASGSDKEIDPGAIRMLKRLPSLILAVTGLLTLSLPAWAFERCKFADSIPQTRPEAKKGSTEISVRLFINDLVSIDDLRQEFTIDFLMELTWQDPRLGRAVRASGVEICDVVLAEIWNPQALVSNSRQLQHQLGDRVSLRGDGRVEYVQRFYGALAAPLDLAAFPLDTQILPITLISLDYGPEQARFVLRAASKSERFSEPGWQVALGGGYGGGFKTGLFDTPEHEIVLSRFDFELEVARNVAYYVWKVLIPITVITFMSWVVFWMDPDQLGVRMGVGTASMLTIVAFLFSLGNILPRVSYLTRIDIFVYSSLLLVFLALVEALTSCTLAAHKKANLARRIDYWARIAFPAAFASVMLGFWTLGKV